MHGPMYIRKRLLIYFRNVCAVTYTRRPVSLITYLETPLNYERKCIGHKNVRFVLLYNSCAEHFSFWQIFNELELEMGAEMNIVR